LGQELEGEEEEASGLEELGETSWDWVFMGKFWILTKSPRQTKKL
jgi:hypothetical protein